MPRRIANGPLGVSVTAHGKPGTAARTTPAAIAPARLQCPASAGSASQP
jgi:hypothetical protein